MKKMTLVLAVFCAFTFVLSAQTLNFFQPFSENAIKLKGTMQRDFFPKKYQLYRLDYAAVKTTLQLAPWEFTPEARQHKCLVTIPLPDGTTEEFAIWQTAIMEAELAALYPEICTYAGQSLQNSTRTLRICDSPRGFRVMVLQPDLGVAYVEPYAWGQKEYCIAYDRADLPEGQGRKLGEKWLTDGTTAAPAEVFYTPPAEERGTLFDPVQIKVYRFAVGATGEFAQDHGGTKPLVLAAMIDYTDRVNAVFERDANLRLQLIAATQNAIFLDPDSDPYSGTTVQEWAGQNIGILNLYCSPNSHDVGHVYARYLGGNAIGVSLGLGNVCGDGKAGGCTAGIGSGGYGDGFVSVLGQEVGHQLNGGHTWNRCGGGGGRHGSSAVEPGSGSTIMSYHGSCGSDNVDGSGILGFHSGSIEEFKKFYTFGTGNTCGSSVATTNNAPVVTLPYQDNFFIPIQTPFELNGSAIDPDGDPLVYIWEGIDTGSEVPLGEQEANSAIFRTYPPSAAATNRYFPRLSTILSNGFYKAEILPEYTRDVTLRFVARDNRPDGGGVGWADVAFKSWEDAGPFLVTSPNTSTDVWYVGEYVKLTWDVANTDAAPVNCQTVNIRLSTDGGQTYPITLASGVANDGSHYLLVPNNLTPSARVRVDAADNIFFDISNANFKIQQPTLPTLTMGLTVDAGNICLPDVLTTEVQTAGSLGFNNPVTLEIVGDLPPGATAIFSKTTLSPGESSTLTIDMNGTTVEGIFTFNVQATAAGSAPLLFQITLNLVSNDFSALALETPLDGSTSLPLTQTLRWNTVLDAESYDVQFSKTPSFSTILASKTATPLDSFKINFLLEKGMAYYWRVRPGNECGIHDWTEPFFFSTFAENCSVFGSNDLPKSITTNGTPTVESKFTVNAGGIVSDVNVRQIKGFHEFFKDLEVHLISPQGTDVTLFKQKCGNYNGYFNFGLDDAAPNPLPCPPANNGQFYRAENPFSPFYGQNNTGTWTLRVKDTEIGSGGQLEIFKLEFCASVVLSPPFVVKNNPLLIQTGENQVITPDLLLVEDANNSHAQLTYTLLTVPEFGLLDKFGSGWLQPGGQFTQADLDAGQIRFFDFGMNAGQDGFRFTVSDGEGGYLGTPKFIIQPLGVGTNEPANSLQFKLFPNPTDEVVWLALDQPADSEMRVNLFNAAGQLARSTTLPAGVERLQIAVGNLPKGIYAVRLESEKGVGTRKLVVN